MHNFTFKDINSRPIIISIKFHISFSLPIFYIFPLTTNNNHNKTNKTLTTATSNLEHHHFSLHNFSSDYLFIFCFSWCYALMKPTPNFFTLIIFVQWGRVSGYPRSRFSSLFLPRYFILLQILFSVIFLPYYFLFLIFLLFIVLFLTLLFYFRAVTLF